MIEPEICAEARCVLADRTCAGVEPRRGIGCRSDTARCVWISPRRRRIPGILHRRIVVERKADEYVMALKKAFRCVGLVRFAGLGEPDVARVADVRIVEPEVIFDPVVSEL